MPYERARRYLLEADVGVSAHFDDLETRFAFRTRLLDCFWAGLPVVTTRGDSLGELDRRAAVAAAPSTSATWTDGSRRSRRCSTTTQRSGGARARGGRARPAFAWPRVVEPLRRLADPGAHALAASGSAAPLRPSTSGCACESVCAPHGTRGTSRAVLLGRRATAHAQLAARRRSGTLGRHGAPRRTQRADRAIAKRPRWHNLRILRVIAATEFKLKYAGSALGYVWSVLKPLALFTMLYLVFATIFKLGRASRTTTRSPS